MEPNMEPKAPKLRSGAGLGKAIRPKTSKHQFRALVAMFEAHPGPPKSLTFRHCFGSKTGPGASPEGVSQKACKKVTIFTGKYPKKDPGGIPKRSQNP